jgi:nicotinamide-nucleotide amidase
VVPSSDIYVAVTGLTTSGGSETPEKPVGTMFIHALVNGKDHALREVFTGDAQEIVSATVKRVARLLLDTLGNHE